MRCQARKVKGPLAAVLQSTADSAAAAATTAAGSRVAHANSAPVRPEGCSGRSQMAFSLFCSTHWRKSSPAMAASVCCSK